MRNLVDVYASFGAPVQQQPQQLQQPQQPAAATPSAATAVSGSSSQQQGQGGACDAEDTTTGASSGPSSPSVSSVPAGGGAAGDDNTTAGASAESSGGGAGGAGAGGDDGTWYANYTNTLSRLTERGGILEPRFFRNGYPFKKRFEVNTYALTHCTWMTPEVLDDANTSLLDIPEGFHYNVLGSRHQKPTFLENYALRKICVVDANGRKHMATEKALVAKLQGLGVEKEQWIWCLKQVGLNRMGKSSALDDVRNGRGAGSGGARSSSSGGGGARSQGAATSKSGGGGTGSRGESERLAKLMETNMPLDPNIFPHEDLEVDDKTCPIEYLRPMSLKKLKELRDGSVYYNFPSCYNTTSVVKDYNLGKMYAVRRDGREVMVSPSCMGHHLGKTLKGNTVKVERWLLLLGCAMQIVEARAVESKKRRRATESGEACKKKKQSGAQAPEDDGDASSTDEDNQSECSTIKDDD